MTPKDSYDILLAFVHECGHSLMMYILFNDHTVLDGIQAKPNGKPGTIPTNQLFDLLNQRGVEESAYAYALICLAGGALEILTIDPSKRVQYPDLYNLFFQSEYLPGTSEEAKALVFEGMSSDITLLQNYYNDKGIDFPDVENLFNDAIHKFVTLFNNNEEILENIFSLVCDLESEYKLNIKCPFGPRGVRKSGRTIFGYFDGSIL